MEISLENLWILGLLKGLNSPSWSFSALLGELNPATHIPVMIWVLKRKMDTICILFKMFLNIFPIAFVITSRQVHYSLEVIHVMIARKPIYLGKCKFVLKKNLKYSYMDVISGILFF